MLRNELPGYAEYATHTLPSLASPLVTPFPMST